MDKDPERASRTNCCCRRILECQPDFLEQACRLAEAIRKVGHLILFLPKFHPELNRTFQFLTIKASWTLLTSHYAMSSNRAWVVRYQVVLPQELQVYLGGAARDRQRCNCKRFCRAGAFYVGQYCLHISNAPPMHTLIVLHLYI